MYKDLIEKYLVTYFPTDIDEETRKNEQKKVRNLLKKLNDPESVFKGLPLSCMNFNEQVKILHFILEETNERQIISNLSKVDADKDYSNIEIDDKDTMEFAKTFFEEEMPEFEPLDLKSMLISNRLLIRGEQDMKKVLDNLYYSNEIIVRSLFDEMNSFYVMGLHFENLNYVKEYIDYIINDILQLVVYKVINNPDINTSTFLQEMTEETRNLSDSIDIQLAIKREQQKKQDILNVSHVMKYFSAFLRHRSKLKEETEIFKELEKETEQNSTLFNLVKKEYLAAKVLLSEEDIKKATSIITEGINIYRYDEKLAKVRDFIDIMQVYGGRQCYSNCLQDLKVYFREIYMSKATYRRQQAHKIVEDYIINLKFAIEKNEVLPEFDKQSQYMFVREKISRGYFREKGLLPDYLAKINFTNELYDLLLRIYLFYDFQDSIEILYEVNYTLLNKFSVFSN